MNIPVREQAFHWRYLWLIALIGLPALGWYGVLDDFSSSDIKASIASAGLIYGTARGINALVSLLQGTELNIVLVTLSVGEVLDPVNDLIERFSEVILVALGSLALQKILLAVVSHTMFNILLSIVAICTGLSLFLGSPTVLSALLRAFLGIAFFRFSLGLVVLANSWVDATFLDEADQQRHLAMEKFQGELRQVDTLSKKEDEAAAHATALQSELVELERQREENARSLDLLDARTRAAGRQLEDLSSKADGLCKLSALSPTCPAEVKKAKNALHKLETEQDSARAEQAALEVTRQKLRDRLACLEKHQAGESCGFWDSLPGAPDATALRQKLNAINAGLSDFAENCINLLVSLLLKTVAIPLLFIYLLLKVMRMNWARI